MTQTNRRAILLASVAMCCVSGFRPAHAAPLFSSSNETGKTDGIVAAAPASGNGSSSQDGATPTPVAGDQEAAQPDSSAEVGEIIVTAQKRAQSINNVGLSITAVTGDVLASRGISDPSQLIKLVSGFNYNETAQESPVYTIRGVGYQDSSITASPTVTVYVDEVPIPYSGATLGAALDIERVEVLKGPQGTLFGGNATGGAINYIAAKPSDKFTAGFNWDFGRFATSDLTGFVGVPLTDTLSVRVSGRWLKGGSWQKSYTRNDEIGKQDQLYGRVVVAWRPVDKLSVELSLNGWRDHSESQAAQLIQKVAALPIPLNPAFGAYPFAPGNARAADWDAAKDYRHRSSFKQVSGRLEYEVTNNLSLISITSYQDYKRYIPNDFDGTSVPVFFQISTGRVKTFFQELRANLTVAGTGNITVGANYQSDRVEELNSLFTVAGTQQFIGGNGFDAQNSQRAKSKGVFASGDVPITAELSVVGGVRYSQIDRSYAGCTKDNGDGGAAAVFSRLFGVNAVRGGCLTLLANFQPGLVVSELNEDNVSWRGGLNYKPDRDILLYANVSRGYKAGAFQSLPAPTFEALAPVVQEKLTAYEAGFKISLFDRRVQLNGAAFYYDYIDKQIRSIRIDPFIGAAEGLINIPKSRIRGFELSAAVQPFTGLSISSSITLVDSQIRGSLIGISPAGAPSDLNGKAFPYTPKWSGNTDAEYRWSVNERLQAVLGATVTYNSSTNGGFGEDPVYGIRGYTLVDLRAGVEGDDGKWRIGVWGRNVTDQYYWNTATRASDAGTRFAGLPATYGVNFAYRY
jgi:iron complex outermembrane recepter protein